LADGPRLYSSAFSSPSMCAHSVAVCDSWRMSSKPWPMYCAFQETLSDRDISV